MEGLQKKTPKLSLLVAELNQMEKEFDSVDFDNSENAISVVTDLITLDDVPRGPFKIQLRLGKLGELYKNRPYRVIVPNPNSAATDESVSHLHVSDQKLCEGDGSAAITASLQQGRLSDFFTMVRSILNTYNPDSLYVALHDWDDTRCYDCGYRRRILNPGVMGYLAKLFPKAVRNMPGCEIVSYDMQVNHIHMVMIIPSNYSVSEVVGRLKGSNGE